MLEQKLSNVLIGIAGVHHVVSELTLKNLVVLPTVRNTAGYDAVVSTPDGKSHAFLQVKTSLKKRTNFWPVSRPEKMMTGPNVYYAFLRYIHEEKHFDVFLEKSSEVVKQVSMRKNKFTYWALPKDEKGINKLREKWRNWRP